MTQESSARPTHPYLHMPESLTPIPSRVSSVRALQIYLNNMLTMLFLGFSLLDNSYCLAAMEDVDLTLLYHPLPTRVCLPSSSTFD